MFETRYGYTYNGRDYHGSEGWALSSVTRKGANLIRDPGFRYEVKSNGMVIAKRADIADILGPLRRTLRDGKVGVDVRLRGLLDGTIVDAVRFYKTRVRVDDPYDPYQYGSGPATVGIMLWAGYLRAEYQGNGTFRFAGMTVCKPNSDHAHGAALDSFDTWANMERQLRQFFAMAREVGYSPKYAILRNDGFVPDGSGGFRRAFTPPMYHNHLHCSVNGGVEVPGCPYDHDTSW